ncbi:MAG TPA: cytochrome c oxidase subunit II [Gaiellaceae bacterium]|nr:cytochrome c oxidase subunit II [Gaiellaceae bacterium]
MRRGSIAALFGIALVAGGVATAVALVPTWLPVDASREGGRIDFVFWFVIAICIALFSVVVAVIVYSVLRFRARPDDLEDGPPIHGHTGLEITWTAIPFVLVTAIAIVSAIVLSRNDAQGADTLRINVTAQQFTWTFSYPDANNATSPVLFLPEGRSVELYMRSLDVIHAFFVPQFRLNEDIVPGLVTNLHVTPDRLGTYPLICNELCGLGHSLMRTEAVVMTPDAFAKWLAKQKQEAGAASSSSGSGSSGTSAGLAVFKSQPCATCHTLSAANATGTIGPDLDKLVAYAQQAHQPLAAFIRESIVNPNAYIQPGFPKNTMPQTFAQTLSAAQLSALVQFLVQSSQKASKG